MFSQPPRLVGFGNSAMREIWLIRHAESTANIGATTSSPATIPLTDKGLAQAECVAAYIEKQPDLVVSSPFLRAQQTAAPLREKFPGVEKQEWDVQEFTYLAPEHCQNTTLTDRKPLVDAYWARSAPNYSDGAGAESFADFLLRVRGMMQRIATQESGFVVVFTHGQFIQASMWLMWSNMKEVTPKAMAEFRSFLLSLSVPNAGIIKVRYLDELFFSGVITSHLRAELRR